MAVQAPDSEVVSAALAVYVGFRNETSAWSGLAHLAEHIACGAPTGAATQLTDVGGMFNAVTQPDLTLYHGSVAREHGRELLDRLLEVPMTTGVSVERIHAEVDIVTDEISAAVDGAVMGGFPWLWLPPALYDEPEFAHNGYGDLRSLKRVAPHTLNDFFARHYVASNCVLVVSGPDLEPLLKPDALATLPGGGAPVRTAMTAPAITPAPMTRLHAPEQPHQATAVAWSLPCEPLGAAHLSASILADVLVGPMDGVLEDAIPDALDVSAYVGLFGDPWDSAAPLPFVAEVHHEADQDPVEVQADVLKVLSGTDWDTSLVTAAAGRLAMSLRQRLADPVELPLLVATAELVHGGAERLATAANALADVSVPDVRAAAAELAGAQCRALTRGPRR